MGQFFILLSRVQQEYNSLLVNALNRIFKSNLSLNTFKWLLTKVELSCVRNFIPRSRKRLWNGYPVLNQELQNHDPFGRHILVQVMYGSTPPPGPSYCKKLHTYLHCSSAQNIPLFLEIVSGVEFIVKKFPWPVAITENKIITK